MKVCTYRTDDYAEKSHNEIWEMFDSYKEIPTYYRYVGRSGDVPESSIIAMQQAIENGEVELQEFSR